MLVGTKCWLTPTENIIFIDFIKKCMKLNIFLYKLYIKQFCTFLALCKHTLLGVC